jgi:hypothetical protein
VTRRERRPDGRRSSDNGEEASVSDERQGNSIDTAGARARRRYEPPRVLHREPLESIAAVCAPAPPAKTNPGFCPQGPISS